MIWLIAILIALLWILPWFAFFWKWIRPEMNRELGIFWFFMFLIAPLLAIIFFWAWLKRGGKKQ